MKETMSERRRAFSELANKAIERYTRGLLTRDSLTDQLLEAGQRNGLLDEEPNWSAIEVLAQSLCSQALYEGCLSSKASVRELAFENLRRYLEEKLARASTAAGLRVNGQDAEVLQQTMLEIWKVFHRHGAGPERPAAFLKWAQVILFRQLSQHLSQSRRMTWLSLEMQSEPILETLIDQNDVDPLDTVLQEEAHEELKKAILALKNQHYQQVLLNTFFIGLEESELAASWGVRVQDIYLWRCRALKALRKSAVLAAA